MSKPKPARLPDPGPLPDFDEKRIARVSFACAEPLKDAVRAEAERLGVTVSEHLATIARQRMGMQRANGRSRIPRDPLLSAIEDLRREAQAAVADGRVSQGERAAMTELLSFALHRLWGTRRTA